jgi:16S rRNA (cytosine967-C5)-methyltransferase
MADSQQTVSPARAAAFDILVRVERDNAYANELLHSRLLEKLSPQDRGLCMEITMGVLRWRSRLDPAIAQYSFTPFPRLDFEVLTSLRIGAYQLQFLAGIPNRAAVNESVNLVKRAKKKSAAALVNVILRKIAAQRQSEGATNAADVSEVLKKVPACENAGAYLARYYAHPQWIVERWIAQYGADTTAHICAFDQQIPSTAVRLRVDESQLALDGVELAPGKLLRSARIVVNGDVTHTAACRDGQVVAQDEGSQLIAALVGHGSRILDCCAAPGGKAWAIADRNPEARIVAADLHAHRARLMQQLIKSPNVEIITADAMKLPVVGDFDRVLVDVPCSGTGTLARNPEIKWRLKTADLDDLQTRQVAIIKAALDRLSPGGRLVYSTCSLEPEENKQVVEETTRDRNEFRVVPCADELRHLQAEGELVWDDVDSLTLGPYLRTIPGVHPCDGFFAAIVERE